ncbi:hypothetical protein [Colwellia sp. RSH04]|uniref:hypothetical protein n=1 Tax=Colwellia sp. RSH04 TaxID=2305464 RepID=UPI000E58B877|nr:hypothetical protein [Colwellia sp. RSH04]RHW77580.1 hypothetical protein D1094_01105 [Colwellia sp. RSH04]
MTTKTILQLTIKPNLNIFLEFHPIENIFIYLTEGEDDSLTLNTRDKKVIEDSLSVLFDYYEPSKHDIDDKLKVLGSLAYLKEINCIESLWINYYPEVREYELEITFKDKFDERYISGFCYCLFNLVSRSHKVITSELSIETMLFSIDVSEKFMLALKGFKPTYGENYEVYEHPVSKPYCNLQNL